MSAHNCRPPRGLRRWWLQRGTVEPLRWKCPCGARWRHYSRDLRAGSNPAMWWRNDS